MATQDEIWKQGMEAGRLSALPNGEAPAPEGLPPVPERSRQEREESARDRVLRERLVFRDCLDFASIAVLTTDDSGIILTCNQAACRLLNIPSDFIQGKPLGFFMTESSIGRFYRNLTQLRRAREAAAGCPIELRQAGAEPLFCLALVSPRFDPYDRVVELDWIIHDATRTWRAEAALRSERNFADSVLDTAQTPILVLDADGLIRRANRHAQVLFGYGFPEIRHVHWPLLVSPHDVPAAQQLLVRAIENGIAAPLRAHVLTRENEERVLVWSAKLLDNRRNNLSILVLGHDITELEAAQKQALRSERLAAIGQVVASLAHESRNALQRSVSCLERLSWRLQDQPEALELVHRTEAAQKDMARLFDEIRTLASPMKLDLSRERLPELWREAWAQVLSVHPGRQALLDERLMTADPWCLIDRFRLHQVFRNLFENALAACADPVGVRVTCREQLMPNEVGLEIAIRDNGPGLASLNPEQLFEPFFTTKSTGSGLGLAIARGIMEAHGGRISAENDPEGGALFLLHLPKNRR